ncbi:MAG: GNAT family N-acetyltransferase [Clostridia bacterium]|nr:GNAT family N-acetyltransferase [Clostridia bacterium]
MGVYDVCPVLKSRNFTLRLVEREDAPGLLRVYSDEETVRLCNSDNCHYGTFRLDSLEDTLKCIDAWRHEYGLGYFVRWSILKGDDPIGTVELFHREAADAFNHHGLLRLDLRSDWETLPVLTELLELLHRHAYELFDCAILATKAPAFATVRRAALKACGYMLSASKLIGHDGTEYGDYWVRPE